MPLLSFIFRRVLDLLTDIKRIVLRTEEKVDQILNPPNTILEINIGPVAQKAGVNEGGGMLTLTDEQKVSLAIDPRTAAGNPAHVDGVPLWSVSDPNVLSITTSDDGLSATVVTLGPLGTSQVSVAADADLGAGVRTLTGILDIEVVAAEAATLGITAGTPELK